MLDILRRATQVPLASLAPSTQPEGEGRAASSFVGVQIELEIGIERDRRRRRCPPGIDGFDRRERSDRQLLFSRTGTVREDTSVMLDVNRRSMFSDGSSDELLFVAAEQRRDAADAVLGMKLS